LNFICFLNLNVSFTFDHFLYRNRKKKKKETILPSEKKSMPPKENLSVIAITSELRHTIISLNKGLLPFVNQPLMVEEISGGMPSTAEKRRQDDKLTPRLEKQRAHNAHGLSPHSPLQ
jgi:hypothetical protein